MMPRREKVTCESCGVSLPAWRTRRLVWARVCRPCAARLTGARASSGHGRSAAIAPRVNIGRDVVVDATLVLLGWVAIALVARGAGGVFQRVLAGGVVAELVLWAIVTAIDAPFEAVRWSIGIVARTVVLGVVVGPALGSVDVLTSVAGGVGFAVIVVLRLALLVAGTSRSDDGGARPEEFERSLPFG